MMENDVNIDKLTARWLKKIEPEEPSDTFANSVMQSVFALKVEKPFNRANYWWFLLFIPVLVAGGWYLSTLPEFVTKVAAIWESILNYYHGLNAYFASIFIRIKSMTISPMIILGFLAVLSLLIIEDVFSKNRDSSNLKAERNG